MIIFFMQIRGSVFFPIRGRCVVGFAWSHIALQTKWCGGRDQGVPVGKTVGIWTTVREVVHKVVWPRGPNGNPRGITSRRPNRNSECKSINKYSGVLGRCIKRWYLETRASGARCSSRGTKIFMGTLYGRAEMSRHKPSSPGPVTTTGPAPQLA